MTEGLLLLDKPTKWTSFDVVNYVRQMVARLEATRAKNIKVGHSGTLDPFASGLLVLLIGKSYTKRAQELSKLDKTYEFTIKLGQTSTTGDPEGELTTRSTLKPSSESVKAAAAKFKGNLMQTPPAYSAIKVNGQRSYQLARAGKSVELEPRAVNIYHLEIKDYNYPLLSLEAEVSSGTYIRVLAEKIGEELGSGAYCYSLRRSKIGNFSVNGALSPKSLSPEMIEQRLIKL